MATRAAGLRERKKQATRQALREAALRLALERGPDNVRVDDIAEAVGVSPRTYNNYFASRDQAIVAAVTADRESRVAAAVAGAPSETALADAVVNAVVQEFTEPGEEGRDALLLVTTSPSLRAAFVRSAEGLEPPLADALAQRLGGGADDPAVRVLAAAVAAAVRVALDRWVTLPGSTALGDGGFVVVSGSLSELLRDAVGPLLPSLTAAERSAAQE